MLAISSTPSDFFGFRDELAHLIGYRCSASSNATDCCSRILGSGSHVIAFIFLVFMTDWWQDYFKQVINPMQLADIRHPANFDPPNPFGPGSKRRDPCERGDEAEQSEDERVSDIDEDEEVTFRSPQPCPENSAFRKRQRSVSSSDDESFDLPYAENYDDSVFESDTPRSTRSTSSSSANVSARSSPFVTPTSAPSVRRTRKTSEPTPSRKPASSSKRTRKTSEPTPSSSRPPTRGRGMRRGSSSTNLASRLRALTFVPFPMVKLINRDPNDNKKKVSCLIKSLK